MKLAVLGCGSVASKVAKAAAQFPSVDKIVVADLDGDRARSVGKSIGAESIRLDASNTDRVVDLLKGVDVVFNGVGPFYRFGLPIVDAAIRTGTHYVDICDEYDVAEALMTDPSYHDRATAAGITVLTGAGLAPGVSNLIAKMACATLDRADQVDVMFGLPFVYNMGVAVNEHMLHSLSGSVTQFIDGQYQQVPAWGDPREVLLQTPLGRHTFGYIGHAEPLTIPRYIPGLKTVTSRLTWWQEQGNELYRQLDRMGLLSKETTPSTKLSPLAFVARHFASEATAPVGVPSSDLTTNVFRVDATGIKGGEPTTVTYEIHGGIPESGEKMTFEDGGFLTAVPGAAFLRRLIDGEIIQRGVLAPEGCVDPDPLLREVLPKLGMTVHHTVSRTERYL